jgi:S-layer homology domain
MKKLILVICFSILFSSVAHASATSGAIDSTNKYAWSENIGWINFNPTTGIVYINDSAFSGHAWSTEYGWINLNPTNGGVTNDGEGTLGGYAWGEGVGWIDFTGVTVNSEGEFMGYATGDITGQINFNCANNDTCAISNFKVTTDWRPASSRSTVDPSTLGSPLSFLATTYIKEEIAEVTETTDIPEETIYQRDFKIFEDTKGHQYEQYIAELYALGVIDGYNSAFFGPDDYITRAQLTKISLNLFNIDILDDYENTFSDVENNKWYTRFVITASTHGIVHGYGDGTFQPDKNISKIEVLKILLEASELDISTDHIANYDDILQGKWYSPYANFADEKEIVSETDKYLEPERLLTRGEVCEIAILIYKLDQ